MIKFVKITELMDVLKRNNVTIKGAGEDVIFFAHGFGCDQNMWRYVAPAFQEKYTIVLFDHVGAIFQPIHLQSMINLKAMLKILLKLPEN